MPNFIDAHQEVVYLWLGQLMAIALLQGGAPIRILSPSVFNYLKLSDIIIGISKCPEAAVRDLWNVCKCVVLRLRQLTCGYLLYQVILVIITNYGGK